MTGKYVVLLNDTSRHADFPSLQGRTYLNTAAEGIPPRSVCEAIIQYTQDKLVGMDGRKLHEARWQSVKEHAGQAFGMSHDQIGICSCSSEAYNLAAMALQLKEGDEVVINDLDFPTGATPWLQPTCPATVKLWENRGGALRVEDLVLLLGPKTRLVTVSLVSFFNGYMISLPPVVEAIRRHSPALLALDVTQALGRVPLHLDGVDLVVSSTHKWILASHGGGLVGMPQDRSDQWTAPAGGWFHLEDPFGPSGYRHATSKRGAASFSVGMPNYPAVYAVDAALQYIQSVGVQAIDEYASPLVRECFEGLKKLSVDLLTPDEPHSLAGILGFRHPKAEQLNQSLHTRNIHIMCHAGRLRVAIHGYNTASDIDRLIRSLWEALKDV